VDRLGRAKYPGTFESIARKFEGGTRVPFLVRWPGRVKPGTSKALVSQVDLVASFAALVGAHDRIDSAPDSRDQLAAPLGEDLVGRESLIEHAGGLAVRRGKWKFIPASNGPRRNVPTNSELGNNPAPQLYDLDADPGEVDNVAGAHPAIVERLRKELDGR